MPSSTFADRAHKFAEELADNEAKAQIKRYLRQRDFSGPVVTFIGATGRGKTTLFGKAAQVTPSPSVIIHFAGDSDWGRPVAELAVPNSVLQAANQEAVGNALLCDSSAFNSANSNNVLSSLLKLTDLAVMAVQLTQPAGLDEVAFVKEQLDGIPSILVLTKCDQIDEDDFQDGLEAVLENYGDFPWLGVLLSDIEGNLAEITSQGQILPIFDQWWQKEGHIRAEEARQAHLKKLQQNWRIEAKRVLDGKEQDYAPQLEAVSQLLSVSSSASQAQRLQDELMGGLKPLPERAVALYKNRFSDLRVQVSHATNQFADSIKAGTEVSQNQIERTLSGVYQEWDRDARLYVRDEIKIAVEHLQEVAVRYEVLIRAATGTEATKDMSRATNRRQEVFAERFDTRDTVDLQGDFNLTVSDKLRAAATPTVSALGTGLLLFSLVGATLFAPFAPLIAIFGGGTMGGIMFDTMGKANQRRQASALKEAIQRQAVEHEHRLQQQLYSEWKQFSDDVRESVAASKRRLSILLMQQSPAQNSVCSETYKALTVNIAKIDSLRRDLRWLEEYEQGAMLISDTQE